MTDLYGTSVLWPPRRIPCDVLLAFLGVIASFVGSVRFDRAQQGGRKFGPESVDTQNAILPGTVCHHQDTGLYREVISNSDGTFS